MKKTILFCIFVILLGTMVACSSSPKDPFEGYQAISTEAALKEFLEDDSAETTLAYLTNDITITNDGDSLQTDQEAHFVVKGNKTVDLNGNSITATVTLTEDSKNYVVQTWPKITGFALIQIEDGAKLTLSNGTVETEFKGNAGTHNWQSNIDKYYFETINNQGEFVAENATITSKTDNAGVTTPQNLKSCVSGVFSRNGETAFTAGAILSEVNCTINNCVINAVNNKGEANAIATWSNTETNVTGSTLSAKGSDSSKGIFVVGHEHNSNNTSAYPYQNYPISLNIKDSSVSVDGGSSKARGIHVYTTKNRDNNSICVNLNNVSFSLTANTTNLIKVEDAQTTSTSSVKINGTSVTILNSISSTVDFAHAGASININGLPL